jgi:hypothetical protein
MNFTQLIVLGVVVYGMVWISKAPLSRGLPSGIAVGLLLALFASDGDTKAGGIFIAIGSGVAWLFYKLMTK